MKKKTHNGSKEVQFEEIEEIETDREREVQWQICCISPWNWGLQVNIATDSCRLAS